MHTPLFSRRSRAILGACALSAPALLGSSVSQAETCKPWHIEASAQYRNPLYDEEGNLVFMEATGSGHASHMGAIVAVGADYFSPPENGIEVIDGDGIFTAPNGDQIFVNFDGTVVDLATGTGTGTYLITGGTGRFANASGTAEFVATSLDLDGFMLTADGTLCS